MGDARIPDRLCVGPFAFPVKWTTTVRINADLIEPGSNPQIWSETVDRAQKEQLVDELGQIFESSGVVVVSHYAGLTVANMQDLRAKASDAGAAVRVAKNRLAKIALNDKPCASIANLLTGMTVLTFSEDPVAAAKVAEDFSKDYEVIVILREVFGNLGSCHRVLRKG